MTDKTVETAAAQGVTVDPLAAYATSPAEKEGVLVQLDHMTSGKPLFEFRLARFGGSNSTQIVKIERQLKAKLPQGQRRAIDNGVGDPDVVARLNRQTFVRVSILGIRPLDPAVADRYPAATGDAAHEVCDKLFSDYPGIYDAVTELATSEAQYSNDQQAEDAGN